MLSGDAQKDAAGTAADAQTRAAQLGIEEQRRQFDQVRALLQPYTAAATGGTAGGNFDARAYLAANPDVAADPYWSQHPEQHFNQFGRGEGRQETLTPVTDYGRGTLGGQLDILGINGADKQQAAYDSIQSSPAFTSLTKTGENAILQNASATGGLRGGNTQAALAQFRPALLAQLIDAQFAKLGGITSMGQNAAAGVGNAGMNTGNNVTNLLQQQGAAQAGAALANGRANANAFGALGGGLGLFAGMGGFNNTQQPSNFANSPINPYTYGDNYG